MANKRIDQLPAAPAAHDADLLVADQDKGGGVLETRKVTLAQVRALMQQALDSRYSRLAGGDDADFEAMPQVDGSPIVEFGSNANGSWTKWADGTMICSHTFDVSYDSAAYLRYDWTFPQEFSATPDYSVSGVMSGSNNDYASGTFAKIVAGALYATWGTFTTQLSIAIRAQSGVSFVPGDEVKNRSAIVFGRWK